VRGILIANWQFTSNRIREAEPGDLFRDCNIEGMEKVVRVFESFEEADNADALYRSRLTPSQRIDIFFEIRERARNDAAEPRLERVCRVLELEQS